jgi:signal transduction histidine kinase
MEFTTDDGVRDCLKEIRTAGEKAAETVKLLQAFGRKQFLHAEVLSLNDVIQGLESTLRKLLGGGIRSELRLDPALDLIQADRGQMLQVLMNLSLNAREAMDGEGVLTVETSNAPAGPEGSGDTPCVRLSVKDTGRGIAAEDQERIFEPYYSTKDFGSGKGLGLGLSSVLGIVGRHNGRIRVHSKPGQGAEFEIFLPALSR